MFHDSVPYKSTLDIDVGITDTLMLLVLCAGQTAARLMASEGRQIAEGLSPAKRGEMLQLCDEVDMLTDQLGNLCKKGLVS